MYKVKADYEGKIDFDLGADVGTRTLSNKMPQAHLERIYKSRNGADYVEIVPEPEKKKGEEVAND